MGGEEEEVVRKALYRANTGIEKQALTDRQIWTWQHGLKQTPNSFLPSGKWLSNIKEYSINLPMKMHYGWFILHWEMDIPYVAIIRSKIVSNVLKKVHSEIIDTCLYVCSIK